MTDLKKCLIIDDDPDDQEIFLMCLKKIGQNIEGITSNSGVEALAMLKKDQAYVPDYIFLDVNMPKMNGVECLKQLRQIDRLKATRILMYSTTSETDVVKESKSHGANDFIMKPSKTKDLKEKLSAIFNIVSEINPENNPN
ncbi:MAG TPA: response regulator [Bacteroidia bacterium]|jgi:PleD family two-component response regulator